MTLLPLINGSNWQQSPQLRILPLPADLGPSARAIGMLERREHARQGITAAICAACHAAFEARAARRALRRTRRPTVHGPRARVRLDGARGGTQVPIAGSDEPCLPVSTRPAKRRR